jgi:hypothetical protein
MKKQISGCACPVFLAAVLRVTITFGICLLSQFSTAQEKSEVRRWDFNTPREMLSAANIAGIAIQDGMLVGKTQYDPYFFLAVPEGGIDATHYTKMRLRLFSSVAADAIGIYYHDEGDHWALGGGPKIAAGWNTYEFDLNTQVGWQGGDAGRDEARVWGGPDKTVRQLRIDPGNQAERDLKIEWIELVAADRATPSAGAPGGSAPKVEPASATVLPNGATWRWKGEGDFAGWKGSNFENLQVLGGVLRGLTKYDSALLVPQPLKFDARDYSVIEFKIKSDVGGGGEIFFARSGEGFSDQRVVPTSIVGDGKWHVYRHNMAEAGQWSGLIEGLRFDPLNPAGANIAVEYFRLLPPEEGNMINNGSFEIAAPQNAKLPETWLVVQGHAELAERAGGGNALVLSGDAGKSATIATGDFENRSVGLHQLSFDYQSETAGATQLAMDFHSIYGEKLAPLTIDAPLVPGTKWQTLRQTIAIPERAARTSLSIKAISITKMRLDNVSLESLESPNLLPEAVPKGEPVWQASWLATPDALRQGEAPCQFRKRFLIDDPAQVASARALVTADRVSRLWVNGTELPAGPFAEDWKIADIYDIAPFLKKGANVIGVQSWGQGSGGGVIAEVGIHTHDGKPQFFVTDASWESKAGDLAANWSSANDPPIDWNAPQLIAKFPGGPWGATVQYTYLGPVLRLSEASFTFADSAGLGETRQFSANFTPSQIPSHPVTLVLELAEPGGRGVSFWTQALDPSQWKVGHAVKIGPIGVALPRYAATGEHQVRLRVPYAALTPAADFKPMDMGNTPALGNALVLPLSLHLKGKVKNPVTKVKYLHDGQVPALEIDGQTRTVMHMMGMNANPSIMRLTRQNGMDLIWLNIAQGFGWKKGGPYDFSELDRLCADLLNQYPQAYLVLNVPVDSVYNPGWKDWNAQNPGELVRDDQGNTHIGGYHGANIQAPSYSSRVWMDDATDSWRALIRHIRSSTIGERVIGYVPISGISWEWFYWGAQSREFVDYSRPATQQFQHWLRARYGDLATTNAAWKSTYAKFEEIQIPTKEDRLASDRFTFLDPQKSQRLIDFHEFFSAVVSADILEFCRIVKEESKGESLVGTYYGYNMQVISAYLAQHTGHMALHKVLQSPDMDFLMSPSRYQDRGIGGGSGFMMTVDSIKLHGKYYIDQADIRTVNASGPGGQIGRLGTVTESAAVLEREFANAVTSGVAIQWYDFGNGWISADARLMEVVGHLQKIEADLQKIQRKTMDKHHNIAVIVDEKSTFYTATSSDIHASTVAAQIDNLHRSGVGFDSYVLDDLEKIPDYKAYLFLNTFRITPAQQSFIDEKLKRGHKVLTWIFAPGVIDEKTLDFSRAERITGFELGVKNQALPLRVQMQPSDHPVMRFVSGEASYGSAQIEGPVLFAKNGQSLGKVEGTQDSGLAVKKFADWTSVFSLAPNLPPNLLRGIAVSAGLPVYNAFDGDVTYVGDRLFAVHSYGGGRRTFTVPVKSGVVRELLHGKEASIHNGSFSFELPEKSTSLFLLP